MRREAFEKACKEVQGGSRGTWLVMVELGPTGHEYRRCVMNCGYGEAYTRRDGWDKRPTFAEMANRMVSTEVYDLRNQEEERRKVEATVRALAERGWKAGTVLKHITFGGHTYSSASVTAIYPETGTVDLVLTKRGSSKRYEAKRVRASQIRDEA